MNSAVSDQTPVATTVAEHNNNLNGDHTKSESEETTAAKINDSNNVEVRKSGAIHSLASQTSISNGIRSSWSNFTANISAASVADSVHAHRQQFLQRRAKFTEGAAQQTSDSKPTKRFEIELKALKLGEQKAVVEGDSWVRYGKMDQPKSPPYTFRRQGSVRERVKSYVAMTSQSETAKSENLPEEENNESASN